MRSKTKLLPAVCILIKDYYDIDAIEKIKSVVSVAPYFRFFISPQYMPEPKYDIYIMCDEPEEMTNWIMGVKDLMKYIDSVIVNRI